MKGKSRMTRKDFELIAAVILKAHGKAFLENEKKEIEDLAYSMSDALKTTNRNFEASRFIDACLPEGRR